MWRILQGIPRSIRGNFNGPLRPSVQQSVCREDEEELLFASTKVTSPIIHQTCTQDVVGSYKKWKEWQKNNFHHHFWQHQCQHCRFLEAVGWSTALLLGCKLSQLWKLKHRQQDRIEEGHSAWIWDLYKTVTGEKSALVTYVLDGQKSKTLLKKIESDVTWAKSPPDECQADSSEQKHLPEKHAQKTVYKSPVEWATAQFTPAWNSNLLAQAKNIQFDEEGKDAPGTGAVELEKGLSDPLEEFSNEWDELCQLYDRVKYNKQGVKFAEKGNYARAILCWRKAGDKGSAKANFNLGLCYETGKGVTTDIRKAVDYYTKATAAGSAVAAHNLALIYVKGKYSGEKVERCHIEGLLQQAAKQGLAEAQTELGVIYTEKGDMQEAVQLFEKAASQKDSTALYFLGLCYENGWGVSQNMAKAAELYSQASKHNHPQAQFNLANFFEQGLGGLPEDKSAALELYVESAGQGHSAASASALRLSEQLNYTTQYKGTDINNPAKLHLKISVSAPVLSSYLKHHATKLGNLDLELTVDGNSVHKSSTVSNFGKTHSTMDFVNQTEFTVDDCGVSSGGFYDSNQETVDSGNPVRFDLGDADSVYDASEVSNAGSLDNYFLLDGAFGITLPQTDNKQGLHKSPSCDRLSEMSSKSDTSDFSIIFDDNFEGLQLKGIDSENSSRNFMYNGVNEGVGGLKNGFRVSGTGGVGGNRFSGFDVFGSSWSEDELSEASEGLHSGRQEMMACN